MINLIDTHAHLDGTEYDQDREAVIAHAREAGIAAVFLPAIDLPSSLRVLELSRQHPGYLFPMLGLHPEEVRADYKEVLSQLEQQLHAAQPTPYIAIGEVGLDYYWSREFEHEQLAAFEEQVQWSVETRLPLMIHCRKAQNEMVRLLRHYEKELPGGVFHCFTGNEKEATELLQFDGFVLGIGGVLTFKKSNLPATLASTVPIDRIVLETDAPYMAPVPMRGQRNESAYVLHVASKLAESYGVTLQEIAKRTDENVRRIFGVEVKIS